MKEKQGVVIPAGSRQVMQSMQSLMIYFFFGWNRRAETHGAPLRTTHGLINEASRHDSLSILLWIPTCAFKKEWLMFNVIWVIRNTK